ncbi:FecR family protein [Pedobacter sp. SYP-B3415]|uniref:FecR family protein n=1 Tax=Pedobacter sp. SYP-B3415 TaxID=2496641 RepID=UPI00101D401A|nr:FecR family protein [Pedobacter sp. SYP-B3415]
MNEHELSRLLEKYRAGTCTDDELRALSGWYNELDLPADAAPIDEKGLANEMLTDFRQRIDMPSTPKRVSLRRYIPVAAALLAGITLAIVLFRHTGFKPSADATAQHAQVVKAAHNRFVQLPDGSRVILKAGSRLNYGASFNLKTREVTLAGEAYFDISHDKSRPFIIRTGALSTRVLGTAFSIRAYPEQAKITVTVTRGKVRVEDKTRVLAVLTPDKQMVYSSKSASVLSQNIDATDEVKWVKQNLSFDNDGFGAIADRLAERFETPVEFDPALRNCPTTIAFSGNETIEEALHVLCLTRGASFKKQKGGYYISGEGCGVTAK